MRVLPTILGPVGSRKTDGGRFQRVTRAQRQSFGHDRCASGCQTHEDGSSPKENVS